MVIKDESVTAAPADEAADQAVDQELDAAAPASVLTPVPGETLDHAPKKKPKSVAKLEGKSPWVTAGWHALERFKAAKATLIAGGTAYYAFLAMFSLLALAYGVAALVSADSIATWLTDALEEALPGLVGDDGIDPEALQRIGRATSIVGLLVLLYSGSAVMVAASDSLHHIYGAPPDGRNFLRRRLHLIGWLAVIGPLIAISFTMTTSVSGFGGELLDDIGIESGFARPLLLVLATLVTFAARRRHRVPAAQPARRDQALTAVAADRVRARCGHRRRVQGADGLDHLVVGRQARVRVLRRADRDPRGALVPVARPLRLRLRHRRCGRHPCRAGRRRGRRGGRRGGTASATPAGLRWDDFDDGRRSGVQAHDPDGRRRSRPSPRRSRGTCASSTGPTTRSSGCRRGPKRSRCWPSSPCATARWR